MNIRQKFLNIFNLFNKPIGKINVDDFESSTISPNLERYLRHYFNNNLSSFEYYFFSLTTILLTKETSFRILGIMISTLFIVGGLTISSWPRDSKTKTEDIKWGYLISGILVQLGLPVIIIYLAFATG